jgi:predicted nucleotidyltransferase
MAEQITPMTKQLASILQDEPQLEFAVLVGSRATGTAQPQSDWDIALQWAYGTDWLATLGSTETLRHKLAAALGLSPSDIDLIDLRGANLAMRASVAEEGLPLSGEDTLAWAHFLQRTWRDLEDFYWDKQHAA